MTVPLTKRRDVPVVVGIVAPGGYAPDVPALAHAEALLVSQGCVVRRFDDPAARTLRFAAGDAERLAGLHAAARDPQVDVVISLRGGYGMSRLMRHIDFDLLVNSGKRFVGHSDFTALNMGMLAHGGISFAGPMITADFTCPEASDFTMKQFWDCLHGPSHTIALAPDADIVLPANQDIDVDGTLWGGNLAMLAHLIGTPWMPVIDGGILFVEDINEHPFRVERMMLQLLHAGLLNRQRAIVMGDFSGGRTGVNDNGYDFEAMLAYLRQVVEVPIVTGLPFGHIRDKATLAVGSQARLHPGPHGLLLTMSHYPALR